MNNIVLVHGGFVDGSGWESVYQILKEDGYNVSVVQNPTISFEGDVAVTKRAASREKKPKFAPMSYTVIPGRKYLCNRDCASGSTSPLK